MSLRGPPGVDDVDVAEARWDAPVRHGVALRRLALAVAVRAAEPVAALPADHVEPCPELGRANLIGHVLEHPGDLAAADFIEHLAAELRVVSLLVDRLTTDAAGLRATRQSTVSSEHLEEFWTALSALMGAESRARELFAGGNENAAADAILLSPRDHVATMNSTLQAFR